MESIKHKMQLLQKETTDAFERAAQLDGEGEQFVSECEKFEKLILEINKGTYHYIHYQFFVAFLVILQK